MIRDYFKKCFSIIVFLDQLGKDLKEQNFLLSFFLLLLEDFYFVKDDSIWNEIKNVSHLLASGLFHKEFQRLNHIFQNLNFFINVFKFVMVANSLLLCNSSIYVSFRLPKLA